MSRGERGRGGKDRSEHLQGLGGILDALRSDGTLGRGLTLGELGRKWPSVVGEPLARECGPLSLDHGTLVIGASSAGWAAQLGFLARELRERANAALEREEVREVRVVLDPRRDGSRGFPERRA